MSNLASPPIQADHPASTTLRGWRLLLARLVWLVTSSLILLLLVVIAPNNSHALVFDPLFRESYPLILSISSLTYPQYQGYVVFLRYLVTGIFLLVSLLIFLRKSDQWLALLTSLALLIIPYLTFFSGILYDLQYPFPAPWKDFFPFVEGWVATVGSLCLLRIPFIFPDGHFQPRRLQKPVSALFILWLVCSLIINPLDSLFPAPVYSFFYENGFLIFISLFFILIFLGVVGQVYRYLRISTFTQRQQTKWIVFSLLVNLSLGGLSFFGLGDFLRFSSRGFFNLFMLHASLVIVTLIPLSLAIAVLRYRLWDIDLIIRRTLVYSLLSGLLGLVYYSGVVLLQGVLTANRGLQTAENPVGSQPSAVVIVATTLLIAALFNPLRRRIQDFIDRRFYRQKYDAEQALAAFAAAARSETDLKQLSSRLTGVVQETLQPQSMALWIKPDFMAHKRKFGGQGH